MKASDWIVEFLIRNGVTDAFGLPGVVVLELVYAMDRRTPEFTPHLTYHEQGAAFAACGYAQTTGKLGVAYATRGPGLLNMTTGIADAYYDSIPTMFITAHNYKDMNSKMRILNNQEMDTVDVVRSFTKFSSRIDDISQVKDIVKRAYVAATIGRKGPVFIDILSSVMKEELSDDGYELEIMPLDEAHKQEIIAACDDIVERISKAKHPVILAGNGVIQSDTQTYLDDLACKAGIPILTSRTGQDIVPHSKMYYGYVGSHAARYSHFILSKADLIIALGNRLSFPVNSKSFKPIVENCTTLRVEVDENEFERPVPNSINYHFDLVDLMPVLVERKVTYEDSKKWLEICDTLRRELDRWDNCPLIDKLSKIMSATDSDIPLVCDVGNHSFWETNAYEYAGVANRISYSGSFGTLGSALPKAIGAYYAKRKKAICFTGDQGFQMNIQELEYIAYHKLPIVIVVLNNDSSGMIREREITGYNSHFVHTTTDSGYGCPNLKDISKAYGFDYIEMDEFDVDVDERINNISGPLIVNIIVDVDRELNPNLPVGNPCQDLAPILPRELYYRLDAL